MEDDVQASAWMCAKPRANGSHGDLRRFIARETEHARADATERNAAEPLALASSRPCVARQAHAVLHAPLAEQGHVAFRAALVRHAQALHHPVGALISLVITGPNCRKPQLGKAVSNKLVGRLRSKSLAPERHTEPITQLGLSLACSARRLRRREANAADQGAAIFKKRGEAMDSTSRITCRLSSTLACGAQPAGGPTRGSRASSKRAGASSTIQGRSSRRSVSSGLMALPSSIPTFT